MKKIVDFYLKSSLHVALAITSMACISYWNMGVAVNIWYVLFIFSGTVVGYNVLKYINIWFENGVLAKGYVGIYYLTIVMLGLSFTIFYIHFDFYMRFHVLLHFIMLVAYMWLRKYAYFKLFYVAFVVAGLTVMFPLYEVIESWVLNIYVIKQFLILFALLIPFEIADVNTDVLLTKTLPQRFGVLAAKTMGFVAVGIFILLSLKTWTSPVADIVMGLLTILAVYFVNENKSIFYTTFWVEALPVFWAIMVFLECR
ncbi:MAG: hypothetical protein ACK4RM_02190 [Flavobacterium sp.]